MHYFKKREIALWAASSSAIIISFILFGGGGPLTAAASLIGVTSLILNAKGNPAGQALMIVFSIIYGYISYGCRYYGEMITYLGMTAPMALLAMISWLKNPYKGSRRETTVGEFRGREIPLMLLLTAVVTAAFFFILAAFGTSCLPLSTLSVTTSFAAVYLTFRRSPAFALAYAANDIVLIILWSIAAAKERSYASVIVCFIAFLANDVYGFLNWRRMRERQSPAGKP